MVGADGSVRRQEVTPELLAALQALSSLARERGQTLSQMALAWVLRDPRVTSALIGASRAEHIEENVAALEGAPFDARQGVVTNQDGRVEHGLYVAGWIRRGPTGVIGTNKPDGDMVAEHIVKELAPGGKPGRPAFEALLAKKGVSPVTYPDWKKIEAAEIAAAPPGAPRRKFSRVAEMLGLLGRPG